jgi:mono/diheme cytochrome c family protein
MESSLRRLLLGVLLLTLVGCNRAEPKNYILGEQTLTLSEELQTAAVAELDKHAGTYAAPRLIGAAEVTTEHLLKGQAIYETQCAQCHGDSGDGNGPTANSMYPRPRNYRKGVFKFTSTTFGSKPLKADLERTLRRGIRGTSMPAFPLLQPEELDAVVDYVLVLARRGEVEEQIFYLADFDEEVDPEAVETDAVQLIVDQWSAARSDVIIPQTPEPEFTAEHARRGRELFLAESTGCKKCHGEDGRGLTLENLRGDLKDTWGEVTRAADLTSGMLHGGPEPIDIYRRIYGGINGTPMPGFANSFADNPDAIWDLVAYVKYISSRRRASVKFGIGEIPAPGPVSPYKPAVAEGDAASDAAE